MFLKKTQFEPINEILSDSDLYIQALFKRPPSLGKLLPYDEFLENKKIFVNKDGSLGAIFKVNLLEHESMTGQKIVSTVEALKSWLQWNENFTVQILYEQSYISKLDKVWQEIDFHYDRPNPISEKLKQKKIELLKGENSQFEKRPLRRDTYLSIHYFPEFSYKSSFNNIFDKGEKLLNKETEVFSKELRFFSEALEQLSSNSHIQLKKLESQDLVDFLRRFFNPQTYYKRSFAPYNPRDSISDQVIYNSPILDFTGIEVEGIKTRTLSLKTAPHYCYPGGMAYFSRLDFPFRLALNIGFPHPFKMKRFFDLKEFFLQNAMSAKSRRQQEEILEVQNKLAHDDRCLYLTFNVIVDGENDFELDERTRKITSIFQNELECEVIQENRIGIALALNALPLCYSPKADYSTQRFIRILKSDLVNFIPIFDSFRGLKNPLQVFLSRENNLIPFSLFDNETSNHSVVLADTGSGKSSFVVDCIQSLKKKSPEPLVFIIDKKSSYGMLSKYFNGDITVFDANGEMPFSPFRGVYDEQKFTFLTQLIVTAVKLTSPSFEIESEYLGLINQALKSAYKRKKREEELVYVDGDLVNKKELKNVELTMEDFIAECSGLSSQKEYEKLEEKISLLLQKLMPFYGQGLYSKYFSNKIKQNSQNSNEESLLYIYDLDALDSDPVLQTLMTLSVFEEIRRIIKLPENKGRGGLIVIEELGMLGRDNPTASRFIIDFAETFRKLGYWLIALTPRPQNYFEIEAGKAMWGVADNFIFFKMSPDNVEYLAQKSSLLDEANKEILKSLKTIKGKHVDVYYMNKDKSKQGAFKYIQTPYDRWLSPTNIEDTRSVEKALKKFPNDPWKALEFLVQESSLGGGQ